VTKRERKLLYGVWKSMRNRCNNERHKQYPGYGGRGIRVCRRWASFQAFLTDMGPRPPGLSLERKKNNEGYSPNNCMWATRRQQQWNMRSTRMITWRGKTQPINEWVRELGIPHSTLHWRLDRWPVSRALAT
jgi:hypothetical protein